MDDKERFQWKRYWVPHKEAPTMVDGYFYAPPSNSLEASWRKSNGVCLESLEDVPCLVLLGDVGMGKTNVVEQEADRLLRCKTDDSHKILLKNLKRMTETGLSKYVFGSPEFKGWVKDKHSLTLFLDSLDECWRQVDGLETILVEELEPHLKTAKKPLHLRLACRSAEWRGGIGNRLNTLFPNVEDKLGTQIFTLAPLSKENVIEAAKCKEFDEVQLLEAVSSKDAQALAHHPVTLIMLLNIFGDGKSEFPSSKVELYKQGCRRLCEELNSEPSSKNQPVTMADQRFSIASRLASLSILTNRPLINGDTERLSNEPNVLNATDTLGLFEEKQGAISVTVERDTIRETLQTGLFSGQMDDTQTWAHQSYGEFLAALYLSQSNLSDLQILSLVTDTSDNAKHIIPQLEETVCWLINIRPSLFETLCESNADILIRCEPANLNDSRRELLVDGYLGLIRRHKTPLIDWQLRQKFENLSHPELIHQLGSVISDPDEHTLVREAAIDIAGFTKCEAVAEKLVDVMLNPKGELRLRNHASAMLEMMASDTIRDLLQSKATPEGLKDPDDDVLGHYIRIMWPERINTKGLLALLKEPEKRNYHGSYMNFFDLEFAKQIPTEDLPIILDWMREKDLSFDILAPYGFMPRNILNRAFKSLGNKEVASAIIRLLASLQEKHVWWPHELDSETLTLEVRKNYWNVIVDIGTKEGEQEIYESLKIRGPLADEDVKWMVEAFESEDEPKRKSVWADLSIHAFCNSNMEAIELMRKVTSEDPELEKILIDRTTCKLDSQSAMDLKESYHYKQENRTKPEELSYIDKFKNGMAKWNEGSASAFCYIIRLLQTDPNNSLQWSSHSSDISGCEGWKLLDEDKQDEVLDSIPRYLVMQTVDNVEIWDSEDIFSKYSIVVPCLLLLYEENKKLINELGPEIWKKWVSVLIAYGNYIHNEKKEPYEYLLYQAFSCVEPETVEAVKRFVEEHINSDSRRNFIWHLEAIWCNEISSILFNSLRNGLLKTTAELEVALLLLHMDEEKTIVFLESKWAELDNPQSCSIQAAMAAALLFCEYTAKYCSMVINNFMENHDFGDQVLYLVLRNHTRRSKWLDDIPSDKIAELWEWLENRFNYDPLYDDEEDPSANHHKKEIYDFKNAVFGSLRTRKSLEACAVMEALVKRRKSEFWLGNVLSEMRKDLRHSTWTPPHPTTLLQSFSDSDRTLIRTAGDLQQVLLDSIQAYQAKLSNSIRIMDLWNQDTENKKIINHPRDEENASDYLEAHFKEDLNRRGIIASREVRIMKRLGKGSAKLVDILVTAVPFTQTGAPGDPVSVIVEMKCEWNKGVLTDMENQLFKRYLAQEGHKFGIFLVVVFRCDSWNTKRNYRWLNAKSKSSIEELEEKLHDQAQGLTSLEKRVDAVVMDARLRV